jgi:AraC-like DNA-binding protein
LEAATHRDRFQILERALLSELARGFDQQQAVRFALRQFMEDPHAATVAGVTDRVGLSPKRFIQAFRDQTGFTPKVFCRIRRFQQVLDRIAGVKTVEWASVALDCGYFDQAHFIHDFRAFSGINPSTYLAYQTPHRNHVPLPD